MRKKFCIPIFFLFLFPFFCAGQVFKNIGIEDGLSSRKVYAIQKDTIGFMWFLTHKGIDRYDGRFFKHYNLKTDKEISSLQYLNWLYTDNNGSLWEISKRGFVFYYNPISDNFEPVYKIPKESSSETTLPVTHSFIDKDNNLWLCCKDYIYIYNTVTGKELSFNRKTSGEITHICQCKNNYYYIGTDSSIHVVEIKNDSLNFISLPQINDLQLMVNNLHYHLPSNQLFIGTLQKGLFVYNLTTKELIDSPQSVFSDITITKIAALNNDEILLVANGAEIYKLNATTYATTPYIVTNFNQNNTLSNNIADIYIDSTGRVWIANHPMGISVRDDRYCFHNIYMHSAGNRQSLVNNMVNDIIEDSEGDLWFATNNGVCFYNNKTDKWHSFLSTFNPSHKEKNNAFLSICEIVPGKFFVGGHSSNIYEINKDKLTAEIVPIQTFQQDQSKPDKYICSIIKGSDNHLWIGGYYNLKKIDTSAQQVTTYPDLKNITTLLNKDDNFLWVGSESGLFLLNKKNGAYKKIELPVLSSYIYCLHQLENTLFIGTNGNGLIVYNTDKNTFTSFNKNNSALISNNIYTILSHDSTIILSTSSGLTRFNYTEDNDFCNWTKEQGLITEEFCPNSGVIRENGNFVFGSAYGAIELDNYIEIPSNFPSKTILSEFNISRKRCKSIPLKKNINNMDEIVLKHNENTFSLRALAINYDYPSDILYSWKLDGYSTWSPYDVNGSIIITNLPPGKYNLQIKTVSNETKRTTDERNLQITIKPPFWKSSWFVIVYATLAVALLFFLSRLYYIRKQRKSSEEKFEFFINTAHDIRTPLTLVKAPLDEIVNNEELTPDGTRNINTALRNVNVLLRLTNNLINFEHTDIYSSEVFIAEHELNSLINDIIKSFQSYASVKQVALTYKSNFKFLNVWFDREKMDSIIRNIISNALKYTPTGGSVNVYAYDSPGYWSVIVKDTGIGIPASEQKKMFKDHFRASNAINSKITGSGMGMVLVGRLVKLHKGKINLKSVEQEGTTFKISFPKGYNHFKKAHLAMPHQKESTTMEEYITIPDTSPIKINPNGRRILVVEDNDELRDYLQQTLGDEYHVQTCENGKDALLIVKEYMPELIISDIMMPEMRGDEMCEKLKSDIETSHIPVILLTALNNDRNIIKGIQTGADEYIVKPFNISILKATIANLLANRARLKGKFASLDLVEDEADNGMELKCSSDLDWKFISTLRKIVEENMSNQDFNVDSLCYHMNMSRTSLYNKVRVLTDSAPSDYMRVIRLNKAAEYLKEGKYSVTEVAEMTGFGDAKYFREVFKKHFAVSPSKYKGKDR
jgi:Signal transduction histidine kinase